MHFVFNYHMRIYLAFVLVDVGNASMGLYIDTIASL